MCRQSKLRKIGEMFLRGAGSFSITKKHDYYRHIPPDVASATAKRWTDIGTRLRKAADKVVSQNI